VFFSGVQARGEVLKGIDTGAERASERHVAPASNRLAETPQGSAATGVILGSRLAQETGVSLDGIVRVISRRVN